MLGGVWLEICLDSHGAEAVSSYRPGAAIRDTQADRTLALPCDSKVRTLPEQRHV
jgi:hypothetical protein